jgi:hypothetical protein
MAKITNKVNEQKLRLLADHWIKKDLTELSKLLGVGEYTVNHWAERLRKSLKAQGIADEEIAKILPIKRKPSVSIAYENITEELVKRLKESEKKGK